MKKTFLALLALCLISVPSSRAGEEMAMKPASVMMSEQGNPFSMTVTGAGKMLPKPGPVSVGSARYDDDVQLPYLISTPKAIQYPRWAMHQGWEGRLVIALEILEDGRVGRFQVMQSTGYRLLDAAAAKAVRTWKFAPAAKNGKFVLTCVEIPVSFQLGEE